MATENSSAGSFWVNFLPVTLVLLLETFLRVFRIGDQLILDDEWHALNAVQDHDYGWIFSHLGHADHSIPLALLYEFFTHTFGLNEITMRIPSVAAGIFAIIALPWLMRNWLKPRECLVMAALISISPLLVNYSWIARPYAMLFLLVGACIVLAWLWWRETDRASGIAWISCTVLAAWLNPVSLAITAAPFLWFAASAFTDVRHRNFQPILRLVITGIAMATGVALLLYSPLSNDFASLAVKSGLHRAGAGTFVVAASLFAGSGYILVTALMIGAAAAGWVSLSWRDRPFANYVLVIAAASTLAVMSTGAEWISHGLVLARYLLGLLAVFLALSAIGLVMVCRELNDVLRLSDSRVNLLIPIILLGLFLAGPLPHLDAGNSQFVHHMSKQFDFDFERNPIRSALSPVVPEAFYHEIKDLHPTGDAVVVETPWYLESNWNALSLYQAVHQQRMIVGFVGGTCAGRLYGELKQDIEGLEFRNFVFLQDILDGEIKADYLVLRSRFPPGARAIDMNFSECEQAARSSLGEPWRTSDSALVFKIPGVGLSGDS